ncbi:YhcN/YlaJ family sporulation lipoprotein [Aciduricibacillus chroicocephali]|uniref:YhcN/YlaJ family sporulation lipoprotein n=1 Tax=Aciduricibacillus chroicocephali TaxID=3054939 RepID=A0ABY9KVL0_9BACI|nr:YhcN/YlaJ family sporulation lipoprotein [Bacillaceae bacterium 44XB]
MKKLLMVTAAILFLTVGCSNNQDSRKNKLEEADEEGKMTEQLRVNEETDTKRERKPQDIQNKIYNEEVAEDKPSLNTNEQTNRIAKRLGKEKDIKAAQVAMNEKKVMIGLMLQKKISPDLKEKVTRIVNEMEPGKEVVIYTDNIDWNRRKDEGITR